jgi:hypothetical protein
MLTIVATAHDGGDETVGKCRAVLEQWSNFGFLHEFIWVSSRSGEIEADLIRDGSVEHSSDLARLFTNYQGRVRLMVVSVITDASNDVHEEVQLGEGVNEILKDHFQSEMILTPLHLLVPTEIGITLPPESRFLTPFIWSAEDRVGVDFTSTLLEENIPAHAAHGVAALAEMWKFSVSDDKIENIFASRKTEGTARLARCFIRFLTFPEIRHGLLADLPVTGDEVVRPTEKFERIDLSGNFLAMADHFIDQHAICLGRSDTSELEYSESPIPPEKSLLAGMKEKYRFIVSFFQELPGWALDQVGEMTYNWLAEKTAKGIPVYSWSKALGEGVENPHSEINTDEILPQIINDGPFDQMWRDLESAVFSLLDGSPYEWGGSLPPRDGNHLLLANSRVSIVGPRLEAEPAAEPSSSASSSAKDLQPVGATLLPEGADRSRDVSWLGILRVRLEERIESFSKELQKYSEELVEVQRALEAELAGEHEVPKPKNWRERFRRLVSPDKVETPLPNSIRPRMMKDFKRRSLIGGVVGGISTAVIAVVLSPIGAIVSAGSFLIATLASLYGRAWEAHVEQKEAEAKHFSKLAYQANREIRIQYLKGDIVRIKRRLSELVIWKSILGQAVMNPYPQPRILQSDAIPPDWSRPLAISVAEVIVEDGVARALRKDFETEFFVEGWLKSRFEVLRQQYASTNGFEDPMALEADSSSDAESVLHKFALDIITTDKSKADDRELLERATAFLKARELSEIAPSAQHLQGNFVRELGTIPSVDFLSATEQSGKFLQGEFLVPTEKEEDAIVDPGNTSTFGKVSLEEISLPSSESKWTIPFIATGTLHFSKELTIAERIRDDGVEVGEPR